MFDNNINIFRFKYSVQLDNIVTAICNISYDIGKQIELILDLKDKKKGFTIEDLFLDSFFQETEIRQNTLSDETLQNGEIIKGYTKDEVFVKIAAYYNKILFKIPLFLESLLKSDIIFINKQHCYYLTINEKLDDSLINALKKTALLKLILSNLKSEKIQNSLKKIETFENNIFYQNAVNSSKLEGQPLLPYLPISLFNIDKIDKEETDFENYWINTKIYAERYNIAFKECDSYVLVTDIENKNEIGLLINDILIIFSNVDLVKYIKSEKIHEYYWQLLQYTYGHKPKKTRPINDGQITKFIALKEDVELNHLLSFLKNNLYISDLSLIKEKFRIFFNTVVVLDKLDFLSDYKFLMSSNIEEETALGIYSDEKKGTNYNLLHWINHKGLNKLSHYKSPVPLEKEKNLIYTLKPALCYYFLEKYFEDFFMSILDSHKYLYLPNYTFKEKGHTFCEIDFLVETDLKFYYFETKTKLTKFYIDDFLKKSSKMINKFKPMIDNGINFEFILLGAYSDLNVKDYQFFINEYVDKKESGYNTVRENLNCIPYYFTVPIPDQKGIRITCIAEPEYDKLKNLVLEICPK